MSDKIKITFPDGSIKEYDKGITALDIAKSISSKFADSILASKFNGKAIDLSAFINEDRKILFFKFDSPEGKETYWHTS